VGSNDSFNLPGSTGVIGGGASVTYVFTVSFSTSATGNYQFSLGSASGTNGQALGFNGVPFNGADITVAPPTATTTPTSTFTSTFTPMPNTTPKVFPNPSSGGPIQVMPQVFQGTAAIKVQLFTTAFRKVLETVYPAQTYGNPVTIIPDDTWGVPLASGLYYAVITVDDTRSVVKLLILR
jgi:hypothetical protein